jgi:peptide/nickel transport system substrate-binding protein
MSGARRSRLAPMLAGLALAACATAPAAALAAAGGAITIGIPLEPPNLDPSATSAEATHDVLYANVFEGLTRIAEDGRVVPALARDWTVSDDGLHYRFRLRAGVHFHDGTPLTAADARFSLERARAADSKNLSRHPLSPAAAVRLAAAMVSIA